MSKSLKEFFLNIFCGFIIGIAFVVPGFSGGAVAVVLGIYDKMISSITGILKQFKSSVLFLMPLAIGMAVAFLALIFPITFALDYAPLPITCFFVGLMLGGMPPVLAKAKGMPEKKYNLVGSIIAAIIAFTIAGGIGFLPSNLLSPNLSSSMELMDYTLLGVIGFIAACALVVPGVSGSMTLMVFGYYTPLIKEIIGKIFENFGHNIIVLAIFAVGIVVGFFAISFLMKYVLKKFPRGTYYAIIGFVIGSVITLFYTFFNNAEFAQTLDAVQIALAIVLALVGFAGAFIFCFYVEKREKAKQAAAEAEPGTNE